MSAVVVAVARDGQHRFSKTIVPEIRVVAGLGIEGDAHQGVTVQHRSRVAIDPSKPNLRQVHLLQAELLDVLAAQGFVVGPADLGENITTRGIDLLGLPRGTLLSIGADVVLEATGLRNPCAQIERFRSGLLAAVVEKNDSGELIRKAGIMAIVRHGGTVRAGDPIRMTLPAPPYDPLGPV